MAYFSDIHECVALNIAGMLAFLDALLTSRVCMGGVIRTLIELEALRYCNIIIGSLTIAVNAITADYSSLYDIETITGL